MNGTMARLLGLLAVTTTLILGGCVAESGEEQEITAAAPGRPAVQTESLGIAPSTGTVGVRVAATPAPVAAPALAEAAPLDPGELPAVDEVTEDNTDPGDPNQDPIPTPWHSDSGGPVVPHTPH
jgi:hypothetical protein